MAVKCMYLLHVMRVYSVRLAPQCRAFLVMVLVFARVLVCRWDDVTSSIVPGCTVMVVLDIPWSRVRVMVLACCGIMVMVFTGS